VRGWWVVLVVLSASEAFGQEPRPLVAPFPLEFKRVPGGFSKKEREELQKLLPLLVRGADAAVPDPARMASSLAELKRQDCGREDECLAQLAKLSGSLYGLYVGLDYTLEKRVVAVGRVVRDDGVAMGPAKTVEIVKQGAFKDIARDAVNQLLAQLGVGALAPFRPAVEPAKPDVPKRDPEVKKPDLPPPPPPPVVVVDEGPSGMQVAGWTMVGVGAASAIAGAVVFATAGGVRKDASGNILAEDIEKLPGIQTQQAAGVGVLAGGLAVGVVGALLLGLAPAKTAPSVNMSVIPVNGGAVATVGGAF